MEKWTNSLWGSWRSSPTTTPAPSSPQSASTSSQSSSQPSSLSSSQTLSDSSSPLQSPTAASPSQTPPNNHNENGEGNIMKKSNDKPAVKNSIKSPRPPSPPPEAQASPREEMPTVDGPQEAPTKKIVAVESPILRTLAQDFQDALKQPQIDFIKMCNLAFAGIPEIPGIRSVVWKLLLGYLPAETSKWSGVLKFKRKTYADWLSELIVDPHAQFATPEGVRNEDHPLSQTNGSQWNCYFKDREIMFEIEKDVKRTFPHLHFFNSNSEDNSHYDAIRRILFIYAKLNPGIKYVQGMNEILAPIYYVCATDPDPTFRSNAEADSFYLFTNLMSEIMNNFIKTLDKADVGISGTMLRLNMLLKKKDKELWKDLEKKGMNPQFYSFRWLTLLLSQEFQLPDVLRLWDSLFSDQNRFEFMSYICCAMLMY